MIVLENRGAGRRLRLSADRERLCRRELRAAMRIKGRKLAPFTAGRDLTIRIGTGAKVREYDLVAEATLYDPRSGRSRQFWFGMLLVRWLWS